MSHELEAEAIIEAFNKFEVQYVVIGAFAAIAQAVPIPPTMDIDFYASPDRLNLERLTKIEGPGSAWVFVLSGANPAAHLRNWVSTFNENWATGMQSNGQRVHVGKPCQARRPRLPVSAN